MKAKQFLQKLRVRPGLQMTTHNVSHEPYVVVDMLYDRSDRQFKLRLCWAKGRSKTAPLGDSDVTYSSKSMWMADRTYRLTDDCIARLAPGLDVAIAKLLGDAP